MNLLLMVQSAFGMATRQILRNLMRSALTTLGIVIGVASVIALVTLGEGATQKVTSDISKMGVNLLTLTPGAERRGGTRVASATLTTADAEAIRRDIPTVSAVAPSASRSVLTIYGNRNWNTVVHGTTEDYLRVRGLEVAEGRFFNDVEVSGGVPVCVLGETPRRELFGGQTALGTVVRLGRVSCQVVGLIRSKGQSTFGMDQDDFILMPLRAFQRRVAGSANVDAIALSAESERAIESTKRRLESLMRERRRIEPGQSDDFTVRDTKEIERTLASVTGALTMLLGAVAAVSLLVGGIGIMNIMLVSVTERTREIGTRMAIGARGREVLLQFVVEAVVLSVLGGVLGIGLGLLGSYVAAHALGMPFVFLPGIVAVAVAFSGVVGVGFGFLPALKASRLNPIEALRHE